MTPNASIEAGSSREREITMEELEKHDIGRDCWTVIDNKVYDISNFWQSHPG